MIRLLLLFFLLGISSAYAQSKQEIINSLHLELDRTSDLKSRSGIIKGLAKNYNDVNLDSSLIYFKKLERIGLQLNEKQLEIDSYLGLVQVFDDMAKLDSVVHYLSITKELIDPEKDYDNYAAYLIQEGTYFNRISDYENAERVYIDAIKYIEKHENEIDLGICYNNLALLYDSTGRYEEAIEMHTKSAEIAERNQDWLGVAKSYNNIGLVHHSLDNFDMAKKYYERSLETKKKEGDVTGVVASYHNIGNAMRRQGIKLLSMEKLDSAKIFYEEALKLSEEISYEKGVTISYINLALLGTTVENFDDGIRYGKIALEKSKAQGDNNSFMIASVNLADTYGYLKNYPEAEKYFLQGLEMAEKVKEVNIRRRTLYLLSNLHRRKKDYQKAFKYYKAHVALSDSISSVQVKNRVNEIETKYQTEKKEKEILEQRARLIEKDLEVRQKNMLMYGGFGLAIILGLLGFMFYNQQKLKNRQLAKEAELKEALARIETQNKLQEQRLRISRDLHDNIGSQLTFVASSVDNLKFGMGAEDNVTTHKLSSISEFTTQTIYELRDTIWAMNKTEITLEDLQARISNFIEKAGAASEGIDFDFKVSEEITNDQTFTSVQGMNLYRIVQEAVNNALKYAKASRIEVFFGKEQDAHLLRVSDNGEGFDIEQTEKGNGLHNIAKRAKDLGGTVQINTEPSNGTQILIRF